MAGIDAAQVCAMVLAGGMGSRMGGMDKGLELLHGRALAWHCVERLRAQVGGAPGMIAINANRNTQTYEAWGCPVWGDALQGFAGPLAGFQTGLQRCANAEQVAHHRPALNYLLTVACDTPRFPLDLLQRLATALDLEKADIAVAAAPEQGPDGTMSVRTQPVFCLMRTTLAVSLTDFLQGGGRKVDAWTARHRTATVVFDRAHDAPQAFFNANTRSELEQLNTPSMDYP
ncbi:MAG: molybdenum cofactor guanylyltransferase MobA [Rhodoferax sp.]